MALAIIGLFTYVHRALGRRGRPPGVDPAFRSISNEKYATLRQFIRRTHENMDAAEDILGTLAAPGINDDTTSPEAIYALPHGYLGVMILWELQEILDVLNTEVDEMTRECPTFLSIVYPVTRAEDELRKAWRCLLARKSLISHRIHALALSFDTAAVA
ncbi:MAG: hypothetical protein DHS80DRAFT_25280 [Piptocephalis tieghemiana]|nr:MAG: hypothetical protein DHS80DRAFT_25280 [Piptocephalis tieghemiana]